MSSSDRPTTLNPERSVDPIPADEDTLLGTTLHETYKVVRFMAEGGMGRVYEAQHTRIAAKRFAIKVLHGELKHSLEVRMRFRREAEAAATVTHPNVVGVHDFGYAPDGRPYLVCDYLEGTDLGSLLIDERPLPIGLSVQIARQLCRALEAAHQRSVIHRDLKPANVFLVKSAQEPDVRVLDFGLSRVMEVAEASVTQTGMVMGTPAYMSPEQAKGERADHRVDIYGVGAVLYTTLTGKPPFDEESPHQTVLAVMSSEPTRPRAIVPTIPPELELVVQKAMARSPDERYASMAELDSALARFEEGYLKRLTGRTQSLPEPPASVPPRALGAVDVAAEIDEARGVRRRAIAWMGLGAGLLVVGGLSAAFGLLGMLAPARALLPSELLLATLAVLGSVFTPSLLFLGWLRRSYWNNSARMVALVGSVRVPVVAGVAVYGVAALVGRAIDAAGPHLDANAAAPDSSGWVGWSTFLFAAAIVAAGAAALRQRLTAQAPSLLRRVATGPMLVTASVAACAAILALGYGARGPRGEPPPVATALIAPEPSATAATSASTGPPPLTAASATQAPAPAAPASSGVEPKEAAPQADLDVAIAGGVEGLMELRARYPKDPRVLKPLALELAKSPEQTSELLRVLDVLFAEAPKEVEDRELGRMLYRAALSTTTSQRAIELMRTRLGSTGADMLFDIVLNNQEFRGRARSALETADVQRNLSPPLKIAYDLYFASTCTARVDLLPQAIKDGDERAIFVLTLFSVKPKTACPKKKPCYAPCGKEAPAMEEAIKQIRARLLASVPKP